MADGVMAYFKTGDGLLGEAMVYLITRGGGRVVLPEVVDRAVYKSAPLIPPPAQSPTTPIAIPVRRYRLAKGIRRDWQPGDVWPTYVEEF